MKNSSAIDSRNTDYASTSEKDLRLLVAEPQHLTTEALAVLTRRASVSFGEKDIDLAVAFRNYDAIWIRVGERVDINTIGESPRCRYLAVPATGLDHIDLEACAAQGVEVISLRGRTEFLQNVRATAEHTIALMLALLRHVPAAHSSVLAGDWDRDRFRGSELSERRVGIVGVGRLGLQVSRLLVAFGAKLRGYDPLSDFPTDSLARSDSLADVLRWSQLLTVHVSLNDRSRALIGGPELALLPHGAVLINTARGAVIDEAALLEALTSGHLGGAALDVLAAEPDVDPTEHPLVEYARSHSNLLLTPHLGGNTYESGRATDLVIARELAARLNQTFRP